MGWSACGSALRSGGPSIGSTGGGPPVRLRAIRLSSTAKTVALLARPTSEVRVLLARARLRSNLETGFLNSPCWCRDTALVDRGAASALISRTAVALDCGVAQTRRPT